MRRLLWLPLIAALMVGCSETQPTPVVAPPVAEAPPPVMPPVPSVDLSCATRDRDVKAWLQAVCPLGRDYCVANRIVPTIITLHPQEQRVYIVDVARRQSLRLQGVLHGVKGTTSDDGYYWEDNPSVWCK